MHSPFFRSLPGFLAAALFAAGAWAGAPAQKSGGSNPTPKTAAASAAKPATPALDTVQARKLYMGSDFEEAIGILEAGLKGPRTLSRADSAFIYKYLGVMYSAKYESRELGKRYLYQLLQVDPSARINDMFASDAIYMIFKNVQDEYSAMHPQPSGNPNPPPPPLPPKPHDPKTHVSHAAWYWAGAGAIAVGTVAYLIWSIKFGDNSDHPIK